MISFKIEENYFRVVSDAANDSIGSCSADSRRIEHIAGYKNG